MFLNEQIHRVLPIITAVVLLVTFLMMAVTGAWGHMSDVGMWGGARWMWFLMWLIVLAVVLGIGYLPYRGIHQTDGRRDDRALEAACRVCPRRALSDEEFETRRERSQQAN